MTKDDKIIVISGSILIIIAYLIFYTPMSNILFGERDVKRSPKIPNTSLLSLSAKTGKPVSSPVSIEVGGMISISLPAVSLRNPFNVDFTFEMAESTGASTTEPVKAPSMFVLQGVFMASGEHPTALIDDKMVSEGKKIYGYRVTKIYPERVILEKANQVKVLRLKMEVY